MFIDVSCLLFGFRYGWYVLFIKSKRTSRKYTIFKFVSTVMLSPQVLKIWIICFLLRSISGPEEFRNMPSPSSRYKPTFSFLITVFNKCKMKTPTNSQTSAPSKHPSETSSSSLPDFFSQGSLLLNNNVPLDCVMMEISLSVMSRIVLTKLIAL